MEGFRDSEYGPSEIRGAVVIEAEVAYRALLSGEEMTLVLGDRAGTQCRVRAVSVMEEIDGQAVLFVRGYAIASSN